MRALKFITGHVIYNPAYINKFQLKNHQSSFTSPLNIGNCQEAASLISANLEVNKTNGVLVAVPIPEVTKTNLG